MKNIIKNPELNIEMGLESKKQIDTKFNLFNSKNLIYSNGGSQVWVSIFYNL